MPPKGRGSGRGRARIPNNGRDTSKEEVLDIVSVGDASDTSSIVVTGHRAAPRRRKIIARGARAPRGAGSTGTTSRAIPNVFHDLLHETLDQSPTSESVERPRKRRKKAGEGSVKSLASNTTAPAVDPEEDEGINFEDVLPVGSQQVAYQDSSEASDDSDVEWEQYDLASGEVVGEEDEDGDLDLTIKARDEPLKPVQARRRVAVSKADRSLHLEIHKMHLLCLISSIGRRNRWCDDESIQMLLIPMVNRKIMANLRPENKEKLSQFRQTDLLKTGLSQLLPVWNARFTVASRGMRKALWVEDEKKLQNFKLPPDMDPSMEKADLLTAAKSLKASRDVGVYLFCALLRGCGLEVRLICSLQPLPFAVTVNTIAKPTLPPTSPPVRSPSPDRMEEDAPVDIHEFAASGSSITSNLPFTAPRRRLGGALVPEYHLPDMYRSSPAQPKPAKPKRKSTHINESSFPVFWVEVLDEAHQKWISVDPIVTRTIGKPHQLEPPASDFENSMSYVLAFEDDGVIRDVTRRYTKAYNAKTRKLRVESTDGGTEWWQKIMKAYGRDWRRDLDAIEDDELAASQAREPMPKNISDFKDHPIYALERHLRANEVLVSRHEVGKVPGRGSSYARGGKVMEPVYRRSDVRVARSADRWYRLGRDVKIGSQPVKIVAAKKRDGAVQEELGEDEREESGTGLYTEEQTEIYVPPPVVNGLVPRNSYGNLDIYVPSMVPKGGSHIPFDDAKNAARLTGVDYAEAITGFKFQGRRGTPIVNGIVAASEYREAILAVVEGFRDERRRKEEDMRVLAALRMWKRFLIGLRIKERVDGYEVEGETADAALAEEDDDIGGGFVREDDEGNGDFVHEDDAALGGGGFLTQDEPSGGGYFPATHDDDDDDDGADDDSGMQSEEYDFEDDGEGGGFVRE